MTFTGSKITHVSGMVFVPLSTLRLALSFFHVLLQTFDKKLFSIFFWQYGAH